MCKIPQCSKRYTDPSSLRKHVKTFNHETLSQNQKTFQKSDESMDCDLSSNHDTIRSVHQSDHVYFNSISYAEHLETKDKFCWVNQRNEITDKIETIRLDQPLDLSLGHRWLIGDILKIKNKFVLLEYFLLPNTWHTLHQRWIKFCYNCLKRSDNELWSTLNRWWFASG